MKPTVHVVSPFHNVPAARFSTCAFASKAKRLPTILKAQGYRVVEYANEGSESAADEKVVMLTEAERLAMIPGGQPQVGCNGWKIFGGRLTTELTTRVVPRDIIAHTYGGTFRFLTDLFPQASHVETGVGYLDKAFGARRIYESEAWRHYHWGLADREGCKREETVNRAYSWVIPMSFDLDEWPIGDGSGRDDGRPYVLIMGRVSKGFATFAETVKAWHARHPDDGLVFRYASGDPRAEFDSLAAQHGVAGHVASGRIEWLGPVLGTDRADLAGRARAMLMPTDTNYVEPFGASGVEGMLTGTPLITADWGAFTETVPEEAGFRCRLLADWVEAVEASATMDRAAVANYARSRFSMARAGVLYARALTQLDGLWGGGWKAVA